MSPNVTRCHFVVSLDIYRQEILFVFGGDLGYVMATLNKFTGPDMDEFRTMIQAYREPYKGVCFVGTHAAPIVHLPVVPSTPAHFGTLSHEIFHAVEGIMNHVENPLVQDANSESWAYLIDYITTKVYENLGY